MKKQSTLSFKKENIKGIILNEKTITLRKPNFNIEEGHRVKFMCNYSLGSFGSAVIESVTEFNINTDLNNDLALKLGFPSADAYLKAGYNTEYGEKRTMIIFRDFIPNYNYFKKQYIKRMK
jgi:hypothetical protein